MNQVMHSTPKWLHHTQLLTVLLYTLSKERSISAVRQKPKCLLLCSIAYHYQLITTVTALMLMM